MVGGRGGGRLGAAVEDKMSFSIFYITKNPQLVQHPSTDRFSVVYLG